MSKTWLTVLLLAACAGSQAAPARPASPPASEPQAVEAAAPAEAPSVAVCGPEAQGPPVWNGPYVTRVLLKGEHTFVPQQMIEGQRIVGTRLVQLSPEARRFYREKGVSRLQVRAMLCLDEEGAVFSLCLTTPPGHADTEAQFVRELSLWRFRPWQVSGKAVRVCVPWTFNIEP